MKIGKIQPPQVVMVTWLDAAHYAGWFGSRDEIDLSRLKMKTVGWQIQRTEEFIAVSLTVSDFKVGDILVIPMGCVEEIVTLPPVEDDK